MQRPKRPPRWLMFGLSLAGLFALGLSVATTLAQSQPQAGGLRIFMPFVLRAPDPPPPTPIPPPPTPTPDPEPPLPPQITSRSMTLRPVPLERVQRGTTLSVEFRYQNEGDVVIPNDTFSLFYPQNLLDYTSVSVQPGDRLVTVDGQRVVVFVSNIQPGERRTGRINFTVNRLATTGSMIDLFAQYTCQANAQCFTNTSRVEVIPNENEGSGGGIFTMPVSPDRGPPGTAHTFFGSRFIPGEEYRTWLNTPDGVQPLNISGFADQNGNVQFTFGTGGITRAGFYSMVIHGMVSQTQNVGPFMVQINGFPNTASVAQGLIGGAALSVDQAPREAPTPIPPSGSGIISGRVQQSDGSGVAGVLVTVRTSDDRLVTSTFSTSDGNFSTEPVLGTGNYLVRAMPGASGDPALGFFAPAEVADVAVVDATTNAGTVLTLPSAGGLSGTITAGGAPVQEVRVYAKDSNGNVVGGSITDASGTYTITNLLPGSYDLTIDRRAAMRAGAYVGTTVADVAVTAGAITPVAAVALQPSTTNGTLGGTVTDAVSGAGLADVLVVLSTADNDFVSIATTDSDGNYTSRALPPGAYRVQFVTRFARSSTTANYVGVFYNNAATAAEATPVTVTAGAAVTGIDAALSQGTSLSGTVSGDQAGPLAGVLVQARDADGNVRALAMSNADGTYHLRGLSAGAYLIRFTPMSVASRAFYPASYDADTSTPEPDPVVIAGSDVTGIAMTLMRGARLVGTVTAEDGGAPLAGVTVVFIADPANGTPSIVGLARTNRNGRYASPALESGQYKLLFSTLLSPDQTTRTYQSEFFADARTLATASAVTVGRVLGEQVGPEVVLSPGGAIAGKVIAADDQSGLGGVLVIARAGNVIVGGTVSDNTGIYKVEGLPPGEVTLQFVTNRSPRADVRRYTGTTSAPVTVSVGDTTDLNVTLEVNP